MARPRPRRSRPNHNDAPERYVRRQVEAGVPYDTIAAEEWRAQLLEASDAGLRQYLSFTHKVMIKPVIADLGDRQIRRWFYGLLDQDQDSVEAYTDSWPIEGQAFEELDEQIRNATDAQILDYKTSALED